MFDLPVLEPEQRKAATDFRLSLLDQGFCMAQFSVYMRFCAGPAHAQAIVGRVRAALPDGGKVEILYITDKQYERIETYRRGLLDPPKKNPEQFVLL